MSSTSKAIFEIDFNGSHIKEGAAIYAHKDGTYHLLICTQFDAVNAEINRQTVKQFRTLAKEILRVCDAIEK